MLLTVFSLIAYLLIFTLAYLIMFRKNEAHLSAPIPKYTWILPCLFGLLLRVALGMMTEGYATDMSCWSGWAAHAATEGPWGFYTDSMFCDYPPGYIYILAMLGRIRQCFSVLPAPFEALLYKLPAILFDVFLCGFLYQKAAALTKNTRLALLLSFLYACNPAVWINSAVWGQVDAIFTLFVILSLVYLANEKYVNSAAMLAIAVVIKPQALLFAPLYLITIWQKRFIPHFCRKLALSAGTFAGVFVLLILPFTIAKSPTFILELYSKTLSSYPFASLNAFNLFTLIGANGTPLESVLAGLSYGTWGTIGILFSVVTACFIFFKGKDSSRYFYASALLICGIFLFGAKMHERYLFPAVALLFMAYLYRRDKRIIALGGAVSLLHFVNVAYMYNLSLGGTYYAMPPDAVASLVSFLHLLAYGYMLYVGLSLYVGIPAPSFFQEKRESRFTRRDLLIVTITTAAYAILAFTNLGNTDAPKTQAGADNIADFAAVKKISAASFYKGIGDCTIYFEFSNDGVYWTMPQAFEGSPCFKWTRYELDAEGRYVRVRFTGEADAVYEAAFFDENGRQLYTNSTSTLFDEMMLAESENLYQNSTYFDEIYHARTAFEHIENTPSHYENTHPPLGKHIIGIGIRLFGMNPFGWRFMGTLFGVFMLPLMYVFAKRLFKSTFLSTAAMLLMTFDFMHFSQTRLATIDSYPVFFILLMYFFMYLFYERADTLSLGKVCLYLGLSGISFGLAIASKWIGLYGGAGLALLFFIALFRRIRAKGVKELLICGICLLFFVVIPFIIYYISYIPINIADGAESHWENFWNYQKHMFTYHSRLTAEHPFSSMWYTWPFVMRPIWYYGNSALSETGQVSSIVGMGNPLIWWVSFAAILACIVISVYFLLCRKNDRRPLFISIGYLSQLAPWMLVTRVVFIYHYFASLPFAMLALVYGFDYLCKNFVWGKRAVCIFLAFAGLLFLAFYPVLSGAMIPRSYMFSALKWFDSWILGY